MNKRIDFLDLVKDGFFKGDIDCKKFLNEQLRYYEQKDIENGGQHAVIFKALYMEETQTFDALAKRFYINVYTLDRYRQRYSKFAIKLATPELIAKYDPTKAVR